MFPYLDNSLALNWLQDAAVTTTTTPTGVDLVNAVGPVGLNVKINTGGSGTLAIQPVMSTDGTTWVNVPAAAILDPITGLATTFANVAGAAGNGTNGVTVYLKRDELYRYVSITMTPVVAASMTVKAIELHVRPYTSQAV